jgi:iron complex outermembrane receptor protein
MEVWTLEQNFLEIMVAATMGSANYSHLQSDQNSSYDRKSLTLQGQQKVNTKGELSFIGIYTHLKAYIPVLLTRTIFNNNPEKRRAIGLRQGYESYDKLIMALVPPAIV